MSSNLKITKTCEWCGKEFIARTTSTSYCSHRCSNLAYKERKRQKKLQDFHEEYARTKPGGTAEIEKQEFLTSIQLSRLLGMCRASIYNYISAGVIKTLRLHSQEEAEMGIVLDRTRRRTRRFRSRIFVNYIHIFRKFPYDGQCQRIWECRQYLRICQCLRFFLYHSLRSDPYNYL